MRLLKVLMFLVACASTAFAVAGDANPRILIRTSAGSIKLELYPEKAPLTVANFLRYADGGFYTGTVFHRVIPNFMIQGGGFTPEMVEKPTADPIPNESRNHLHNERGSVAMARTDDPDSATSQFFINVRSNLRLDFDSVMRKPGYTVFGRVIEGMDVVDGISLVNTGSYGGMQAVPVHPIVIESVERIE